VSDLTLVAYAGDAKTLLAWDLDESRATNLAGFTIETRPPGVTPYYLGNMLRFEVPADHAQDPAESSSSSVNAPFHKFRWLHVPGSAHQGLKPVFGTYTYVVTPRYFDGHGSLQPLDESLSASVDSAVTPFDTPSLTLAFTRGYVQSQGYVNHFGAKAVIRPDGKELLFDTSQVAGTNASGEQFTFAEQYEWLGFTARETVFSLLNEVLDNEELRLDMFAYDLNEPDVLKILLELAKQGRMRVILDNAPLHHSKPDAQPKPEDEFEALFVKAAKAPAEMKRGKFGRFAHDKILIVSDASGPIKLLTGSTNFSVTGFYVNSNHVLVLTDPTTAAKYAELFQQVWDIDVNGPAYRRLALASERFSTPASAVPALQVTFAPHSDEVAGEILGDVAARIEEEAKAGRTDGSVFFAVMSADDASPVFDTLNALHANDDVFSFGISDSPAGISLYAPGKKTGVVVTGKPAKSRLPPPFNQVPGIGIGHQIHHKFVVCGFDGPDPVVFCGSSNLAPGGEQANGDNLLEIHDADVARAFMIEALALVDHFQFLNRSKAPEDKGKPPPAAKQAAAAAAGWFLSTSDDWVKPYFDPADLHSVDRRLFA
jgi:phosphatidylserine/phosphatidylglycerophosphate/cardiolipin synthase-like enzyme